MRHVKMISACICVLAAAAGCSSPAKLSGTAASQPSASSQPATSQTPTPETPTPQTTSTGVPTGGTVVFPTVAVGKTVDAATTRYDTNGSNVSQEQQVTLLAARTSGAYIDSIGSTSTPSAGSEYLCLQFKIKNTGQTPDDISPFDGAASQWVGKDGRVSNPSLALIQCHDLGVGTPNDELSSQTTLTPGQYVIGTVALEITKSEPGVIQLMDNTQTTFLQVDY